MLIGRSVFVYRNDARFTDPIPGIVTGIYPDSDVLIDVETFHRKASQNSHTVPLERITFCETIEEARTAFGKGIKYVASAYDPADPEAFEEKAEAPTPAKPKK